VPPEGFVNASQVMFEGETPPSVLPLPSRPWQLAQGREEAETIAPSLITAATSAPDELSPRRKRWRPRSSSGARAPPASSAAYAATAGIASRIATKNEPARREIRRFMAAASGRASLRNPRILRDGLDDREHLRRLGDAESFLPKAGLVVADQEERRMAFPVFGVEAELAQGELPVLLRAGQEVPAGLGVETAGEVLHLGRRVLRIDREREEMDVFAEAVARPVLDSLERSGHRRTGARALGEHGADDDDFAVEKVAVEPMRLAVLIGQFDVREVAMGGGLGIRPGGRHGLGMDGRAERGPEDPRREEEEKKRARKAADGHVYFPSCGAPPGGDIMPSSRPAMRAAGASE